MITIKSAETGFVPAMMPFALVRGEIIELGSNNYWLLFSIIDAEQEELVSKLIAVSEEDEGIFLSYARASLGGTCIVAEARYIQYSMTGVAVQQLNPTATGS